jgi:hypothetical protein
MNETLQDLATVGRIAGQIAQALAGQQAFWVLVGTVGFIAGMNFFMAAL